MPATHNPSSPPSADSSQSTKPETEPSASGPVGGGESSREPQIAARDAFFAVHAEGFRDCEELIAHMVEGMMTKPGLAREEIAILAGVALAIRVGQHRESEP